MEGEEEVHKEAIKHFKSSRLSRAISDCLDLLDLPADELDWTLSASQNPNNNNNENSGCLLWFEDLTDLRISQQNGTEKPYLRVTASDLWKQLRPYSGIHYSYNFLLVQTEFLYCLACIEKHSDSNNKRKVPVAVTVLVSIGVLLLLLLVSFGR
ncbi:hypothetical protein LguiA_025710 [Lonicera macranthoides]